jgi:hypothetical protein
MRPVREPGDVPASASLRFTRPEVVFLLLLIVAGAWLRFYRIGTGLWFDEIATLLESVRHPLAQIVTRFPSANDSAVDDSLLPPHLVFPERPRLHAASRVCPAVDVPPDQVAG